MRPLKGYTNHTVGNGAVVEKTYDGPDAEIRLERERALLTGLRGRLPVPPLREVDAGTLRLGFVDGMPGQELLDAGHAAAVLTACGKLLRRIHATEVTETVTEAVTEAEGASVPGEQGAGKVLVHGDFGPNNVLLDPVTFEVTGVVDWEFARIGDPVEDLAWCEWNVRMHHPEHRQALGHLFSGYGGEVPAWPVRKAAMVAQCEFLRQFCHRWAPKGPGVRQWRARAAATARWEE